MQISSGIAEIFAKFTECYFFMITLYMQGVTDVVVGVCVDKPNSAFGGVIKTVDGRTLVSKSTFCVLCHQTGWQH